MKQGLQQRVLDGMSQQIHLVTPKGQNLIVLNFSWSITLLVIESCPILLLMEVGILCP
jgi:hypothetical protein